MTERPILFSAEMVRAILDGRKTQTRRVCKFTDKGLLRKGKRRWHPDDPEALKACPYGAPGDLLWVRETWCLTRDSLDYETGCEQNSFEWEKEVYGDPRPHLNGDGLGACAALHYPADGEENTPSEMWPCIGLRGEVLRKKEIRWRPSIHMPRWASRITLRITDVRVERLQDISETDAGAEGMPDYSTLSEASGENLAEAQTRLCWRQRQFASLWNRINGPGAWEANPWVWAISFERVTP